MPTALHVLQIEDSESDARLIIRQLEQADYQVRSERVEDVDQLRAALISQVWDVIICDYRLPQFDAPAALALLQQTGQDIPFIVVSGTIGEEIAVAMMRNGAQDYLMKDSLARLVPSVAREVAEAHKRREARRAEEAMRLAREVLANIAEGVLLIQADTQTIVYANPSSEQMFGYAPGELIGKEIAVLNAPTQESPTETAAEIARHLNLTGIWNGEIRNCKKDGTVFWCHAAVTTIKHADYGTAWVAIQQDITQRKMAEDALRAALDEKTALLQEIHHRVKNNLQIVVSLLSLQTTHIKNPEVIETLQITQDRVRSMALLHETLYGSASLARISFGDYAEQLCRRLFQSHGILAARIKLSVDITRVELAMDQAVPCGLIINELVSNALKHAFPAGRAGQITVTMETQDNGRVRLIVADDGVGLPPGWDMQGSTTLGLKLVYNLTLQLKGTIVVEGQNGATYRLTFPITAA